MKLKALFKVRLVLSSFLLLSHAVGQNNTEPLNMGPIINSGARDAEPTFTSDGQTMYFNCFDRKGKVGSDICVTHRQANSWTEPEIVGAVSTDEYLEVEPLLSPDGNQLFIMSNRPGGLGGTDIWVSDLVGGEWTRPRNLGAPFNSPESDHCLYFSGGTGNLPTGPLPDQAASEEMTYGCLSVSKECGRKPVTWDPM